MNQTVEDVKGTVMDTEALCAFVENVYHSYGSYPLTAQALGDYPMSIWRAVNKGIDPKGVRRHLHINKVDRVRVCFEASESARKSIDSLCKEVNMTRAELLIDMLVLYRDALDAKRWTQRK